MLTFYFLHYLLMLHFSIDSLSLINSAVSLQSSLFSIAARFGESQLGYLDVNTNLAMSSHTENFALDSPAVLRLLIASGIPTAWLTDDMGMPDLFLKLAPDPLSYCAAWAALERLNMDINLPDALTHRRLGTL